MHPTWFSRGHPHAPALLDITGAVSTYGALDDFVSRAAATLRHHGLGADQVGALVLDNGPEMATAFLATSLAGAAAPLNPAYRAEELEFYLADLDARVLIVARGLDSPAAAIARRRGMRVVELSPRPGAPGTFDLRCVDAAAGPPSEPDAALPAPAPDATALILHTSGTTSRPKMVPLSHANLRASARHVAETLALTPADRCLNVMPLFHIHGIVACLLASLHAGGSVVCTPGFSAPHVFSWLADRQATWYSAVPTMHQALVARGHLPEALEALSRARLRFARSSSAALPGRTLEDLESLLGVPVVEAYGMTEAAHQMASNPVAPGARRKPGSVGPAAGPEIAIVDATGAPVPPGARGEVVIRGPNVTRGYLARPEANAASFHGAWFRTGDEGSLDEDGYLWLSGRLKEQINRGGEKIAPLEIDEVLSRHPDVAQAVTFALPHPTLGEDVAAAVVLRPAASTTERALREHVATHLAYFKVPRRIALVTQIPLGPTGKLQRIGLAERLGLTAELPVDDGDTTPPATATEEIVAEVWARVLGQPPLGRRRNFFAAGGDSIGATRLVAQLRDLLAVELPLLTFFDAPTVAAAAQAIDQLIAAEETHEAAR